MRLVRTFKTRVAGAALLTTLGALLIGVVMFLIRHWGDERDNLVQRDMTLAAVMASNASTALTFRDVNQAQAVLVSSRRISSVRGAAIFDGEGRLFALTGQVSATAEGSQGPTRDFVDRTLIVHVPVLADNERVGELVLVSDLGPLYRTFAGYLMFAALIFAGVTAAALSMADWLARRVTEPVEQLSAVMRAVRESGDFSQVATRSGDEELARLADEFNGLLEELARRNGELEFARDEADAANRLKTEFLANMSHELRTPLNGVLGMAHLLDAGSLTADQRTALGVIRESADNLLGLLNDVLDVAKIEAGRLALSPAPFRLEALVEETCAVYRPLAEAKGLTLLMEVAPCARGMRIGDAERVRQILTNLLSNAVKFTASGAVEVEVESDDARPERVRLVVRDTGIGIAEDKLPLLFRTFSQVDASSTRKYGGSGLGLAICRELAQLMGGDVGVDSQPGEGSVFTAEIDLPAEAEPSASKPPPAERRVLAATTDPRTTSALKALIELAGSQVRFAEFSALPGVGAGERYDIVLLEGRKSGETARALRASEARAGQVRTPVLLIGGDTEVLRSGVADAVLPKPIVAEALYAAIERLTRSSLPGEPDAERVSAA